MSVDIDPMYQSLSCLKLSEASIEKSIDYVRILINAGNRNIKQTVNSKVVIIFGTTGCGKSTILNWLVGCTMESNEENDSIRVLPFNRGGKRDEVFPIGSEHITSKTIIPSIYPLTDTIVVCDSPGFADSRGSEFSIANAVNIMSILKSSGSLGFILLFNVHEILATRGDRAKETLHQFIELFGSIELVNKYSDNITIGITHAHRSQHKKALKMILDIFLQVRWQVTEDKVNILDPLEKEGNISLADFLNKLVSMPRILKEQNFNLAPLSPKDILLINYIAEELYLSCERNWDAKDIDSIIANYKLLDSLLIIGMQPILLNAIISIRRVILENVQFFIDTNIFKILNEPYNNNNCSNTNNSNHNNNRDNYFNSINFIKSISFLDVCFTSTVIMPPAVATSATSVDVDQLLLPTSYESTAMISSLIDNTLQKIKEKEGVELTQSYYHYNNNWKHIHFELSHKLAKLAKDHLLLFSDLDSVNIDILSLCERLPFLNDILSFLNKIKQDNHNYQSYYYFGNQLTELTQMFQDDIQSSIINMITAQAIPAKCELLLNKAIQSITILSLQTETIVKTHYSDILKIQESLVSNNVEFILSKLIDFQIPVCSVELSHLLISYAELKRFSVSTTLELIIKKYNLVYNSIYEFWAQLISTSTIKISNNIQLQLTQLQLHFSEATVLLRYMITPFVLTSLSVYPLLTEPCQCLLTSLKLLSGCDNTLLQETMDCLGKVLLTLQTKLKQTVCINLSHDIERHLSEYLVTLRSDSRSILLLKPLDTLFHLDEDTYNEVILKMLISCEAVLTKEVRHIIQLPLSEYRGACLQFEHRAEQCSLLFCILKPTVDTSGLLSTISSGKHTLDEYEKDFLEVTRNEVIAEANNTLELITMALNKYIQLETEYEKTIFDILQPHTVIQTLRASNCLSRDVTVTMEELRKKAALVEHAVVFSDMGNVRLLELVEGLRTDIATAVESANVQVMQGKTRNNIKIQYVEFLENVEKIMTVNPRVFCMKGDLDLVYLQSRNEFHILARSILKGLRELTEQNKVIEERRICESLVSVKVRAKVHYSFQLAAQIDGWCVSNTVGANISQLKDAFNTLKRLEAHCYDDKKASFAVYCNTLQDIGQIQTAIRAKNFNDVFTRRDLILKLKQSIPIHVNITVETLDEAINDFMNNMFENAVEEIERSVVVDNFLDFSQLREFMEVCRGLKSLTAHLVKVLSQKAVQIFGQLFDQNHRTELMALTTSENDDLQNVKLRDFAKRFVKYFAVARELDITPDFVHRMGGILAEIPAPVTDSLSRHISELQAVSSLATVCGEIFDAFKVFSRINIAKFNRIAGHTTFEKALTTVDSDPPCKRKTLKQAYSVFIATYNLIITNIVNKRYNYPSQQELMLPLCSRLQPYCYQLSKHVEDTAKLLAYVCGHYSYTDAKETYFSGAKDSLLQVHGTQILSIFLLLGIDQAGRATGQLNQILTGEGKSITLAIVATVFALLGVTTKIICFSSYLTHKDSKLFESFYKSLDISDYIVYRTISDLVETVMDESLPDLRAQVTAYLKGDRVAPFVPTVETGVLLIDEVDVFFGEDFYGNLYHPATEITNEPAHDLMMFMWNNRKKLNKMSAIVANSFVLSNQKGQIELLVKEFPRISPLLPPVISRCCQILRTYYHSTTGVSKYSCFVKDNKIAMIDPRSGAIENFTGPMIMFEYCRYHEQLQSDSKPLISDESLRRHVGLTINCGYILFAELPKRFQLVHGVGGTLASFQREENDILDNYGFERKSFIPSTFQKSPAVDIPTTVITGTRSGDYFDRIKAVLQEMLRSHRAVLVFFETYEILEAFRKELINKPITLPNYRAPEILSEYLSPAERDGVISRAINTCKITLCTKLYMRGTDFKCRDTQLVKNGGVHVLLTFYPDTETDEIQARGRTCRQNDPGSFQMILFAQDLVDKDLLRNRRENKELIPDLSEADELLLEQSMDEANRWSEFLKRKREAAVSTVSNRILATLATNTPIHEKTLEMSRCMENGHIQASVYLTSFQEK